MPLVTVANSPATCGHNLTGSTKVFIQNKGVSRVELDTAGGLIIGPGSQNVFVENRKVSLVGDVISTHGLDLHSVPFTAPGQNVVSVGTGFLGDVETTGEAPKPNIVMTLFAADKTLLECSGQGHYPPTNMQAADNFCNPDDDNIPGGLVPPRPSAPVYSYTVKNSGSATSQSFSVGFYWFTQGAPGTVIITQDSEEFFPGAQLVETQAIPALAPGETRSGTFEFPELYTLGTYVFGMSPDVFQEVTEPDEANTVNTITVSVTNNC